MSGSISVPFAIASVLIDSSWGRLILALLAATSFGYASFRVWADERQRVVDLETQLTPRLALSYDRHAGITSAIERRRDTTVPDQGFIYVRARVDALSKQRVVGCNAYIVNVWDKCGARPVPLTLPQPVALGSNPFDVLPEIPRHVDIMRISEETQPKVLGAWPIVLEKKIRRPGTYVFEVKINPAGGATQSICIEVTMDKGGIRAQKTERPTSDLATEAKADSFLG